MPKRSPSKSSAKVSAAVDEAVDDVLVFERIEINFPTTTLKFFCTLRNGTKLLDEFTLGVKFHEPLPQSWSQPASDARPIILGLGMACISHVWTGFCTSCIVVKAGYLTPQEVDFWKDAFRLGLCEHLLVNRITSLGSSRSLQVDIRVEAPAPPPLDDIASEGPTAPVAAPARRRVLVPLGGGKDSTTVLEMLKRAEPPPAIVPFFLGDPEGEFHACWRYGALCELAGCEPVCIADFWWPDANYNKFRASRRSNEGVDGKPAQPWDDSARLWAAMVAFASALAALLRGCDHVAVGNERSANLGNGVSWGGVEVNHQHDKSFAFEQRAHEYFLRCTQGRVYYFSALMHLWDLQVVELFARICQPYLPLILSCNEPLGHQNSRWCAECEKCAFVYILLGAFLEPSAVMGVFGDDLLQTQAAAARFDELLGLRHAGTRLPDGRTLPGRAALEQLQNGRLQSNGLYAADGPEAKLLAYLPGHDALKPLDCVGTSEEATIAMWLTERRRAQWAERRCRRCAEGEGGGGGGDGASGAGGGDGGNSQPSPPPTNQRSSTPLGVPAYLATDRWKKVKAMVEKDTARALALLDEYNEENNHPPWFGKVARMLHDERWRLDISP